jgi:hypothetical protein
MARAKRKAHAPPTGLAAGGRTKERQVLLLSPSQKKVKAALMLWLRSPSDTLQDRGACKSEGSGKEKQGAACRQGVPRSLAQPSCPGAWPNAFTIQCMAGAACEEQRTDCKQCAVFRLCAGKDSLDADWPSSHLDFLRG